MAKSDKLTFHIYTEGSPQNLLPLFRVMFEQDLTFDTIEDLRAFTKDLGLSAAKQMNNLAEWIGLLEKNQQGKFALSDIGKILVQLKPTIQAEIVHYLLYTSWQSAHPEQNTPLWSYRQVVDTYWKYNQVDVVDTASQIAEEINNNTSVIFSEVPGYSFSQVSFSNKSIRGVRIWLDALNPPVIDEKTNTFSRRHFCPPELLLLAMGWVAQQTEGEVGIDFLLTPTRRELICQLCLLEPNTIDSVLDWVLPKYSKVILPGTSAGVYGRFVRFLKWPELVDLL